MYCSCMCRVTVSGKNGEPVVVRGRSYWNCFIRVASDAVFENCVFDMCAFELAPLATADFSRSWFAPVIGLPRPAPATLHN